jgi:hypothetical protein
MTPAEYALLAALKPIAERVPEVAETITKILTRAIELVAMSGKGGDVRVWERAIVAAASEYASERTAEEWLSLRPFSRLDA